MKIRNDNAFLAAVTKTEQNTKTSRVRLERNTATGKLKDCKTDKDPFDLELKIETKLLQGMMMTESRLCGSDDNCTGCGCNTCCSSC